MDLDLSRALTLFAGHALPALIALYALRCALRDGVSKAGLFQWAVCTVALGYLSWLTAKGVRTPVGGGWYHIEVLLTPAVAILSTLAVCSVAAKQVRWYAIWLSTWLATYITDWLCCLKLFPSAADAMLAIGGAGLRDGLLVIPALCLLAAWGVHCDRKMFGLAGA